MKYVFFCLLLLNGGYLALQLSGSESKTEGSTRVSPEKSGATIQLLSERASPRSRNAEMNQVVSNPHRGTSKGTSCGAVGPFKDVFSGQDALEQLMALELSVDLKAVDVVTGENDFRVLIPPASSSEEAFRKLRELQASNIDSYVISEGSQALGISLGVFSTPSAAEALKNRVQEMGYAGEILEINRLSRTYWIFPRVDVDLAIEARSWMATRPDLELKQMKCVES